MTKQKRLPREILLSNQNIKTRFAPSPTGYLHIGGARTALFAYLYAKRFRGEFVLRIEDTDLERSTQASIDAILEAMNWLGLTYDEKPIYQTERFDRYKIIINQLLKDNKAYYCQCSPQRLDQLRQDLKAQGKKPKYDNKCRHLGLNSGVIRFKNPQQGQVIFKDLTKGSICIQNNQLDDLIIARSDGSPTYNLTVVVDDHDMNITTVIRGDDHINNTPRQINLYQALGWHIPDFSHLPMILGSDGGRLSKRHGAMSVMQYKEDGFLPQVVLNYLVRLGWSHGDQELFSLLEMLALFDVADVNQSPASFDGQKLLWLNQQYIKNSSNDSLLPHLQYHLDKQNIDITQGIAINQLIELLKPRTKTLVEMAKQCRLFYQTPTEYEPTLAKKQLNLISQPILVLLLEKLTLLDSWHAESIKQIIVDICAEKNIGFGKVGQPFRLALSGDGQSPSIDITAQYVGKEQTLLRLNQAINYIGIKK